ncbi:MAG: hypothetical protein ACJ786_10720 [Catenulispora sp.]
MTTTRVAFPGLGASPRRTRTPTSAPRCWTWPGTERGCERHREQFREQDCTGRR